MFLYDTVALSEATKPRRNPGFQDWASATPDGMIFTSVLCIGEVRRGLLNLPDGDKRERLVSWLERELLRSLGSRVLPVTTHVAEIWGGYGERGRRNPVDTLLCATAAAHGLTVVTRNMRDFTGLDVRVLNPWT